jgi:hypothetical protein
MTDAKKQAIAWEAALSQEAKRIGHELHWNALSCMPKVVAYLIGQYAVSPVMWSDFNASILTYRLEENGHRAVCVCDTPTHLLSTQPLREFPTRWALRIDELAAWPSVRLQIGLTGRRP